MTFKKALNALQKVIDDRDSELQKLQAENDKLESDYQMEKLGNASCKKLMYLQTGRLINQNARGDINQQIFIFRVLKKNFRNCI